MTPRQLVDWATDELDQSDLYFGHGTDNAFDEAAFIVLHTLNIPFDDTHPDLDKELSEREIERVKTIVKKRITTRKPAAYLLGEAWFAGLLFHVDENVLVPRSPFAELISENFTPWCQPEQVNRILDIGTGSGCIAIASALAFPDAGVDAIDISPQALLIAHKNRERYGLEERVDLLESDLFENLAGRQYDLIIANPPYVGAEDMASLPEEFRHEPELGLAAGEDGLDIVKRILNQAADYLTAEGVLAVEVGNSQYALEQQYPKVPFMWMEFEHGGEGVFLLTRDQLLDHF